ncbi:MAG: hypothetical protein HYY13_00760 [Nitrospirae bacterium]|nr:hypothetical protein [Nitrospirota bacterium]
MNLLMKRAAMGGALAVFLAVTLPASGAEAKARKATKVQCCLKKEGCLADADWQMLTEKDCKAKGGTLKEPAKKP